MKRIFTLLGISLMSFYGQSQSALDFEETSFQYVDIGTSMNATFTGTSNITLEGWVKLESSGTYRTIVGNHTNGMQFLLRVDNGIATFWVDNGTGYTNVNGTSTIPVGTWTHIAGSWDGSTMKVYVNGTLENSTAYIGTFPSSSNPVRVGASFPLFGGGEYMDGLIDDVRIWNITRTDAEISANMSSCSISGSELGLLALYDFETGSGTTLFDRTGNGYNGNLISSPVWALGLGKAIIDQPINTADFSAICYADTSIELASSESNIYYFLRDNANDSIISGPIAGTDSTINLPTGNVSATSTYNVFASNPSNALSFNGVDQYAYTTTPTGLPSGGVMTVEAWVKPNSYPDANFNGVVSWGNRSCLTQGESFILSMSNSGRPSFAGQCNDFVPTNGPTANLNEWNHIAAVINGATVKLYLNGYEWVSTLSVPENVNGGDLYIGATDIGGSRSFDGQIDEVRIWSTERTKNEIVGNAGKCLAGTETGLTTYFQMEEGSGTTITDMVNGNVLTIVNSPWVSGAPVCASCNLQLSATPTITINTIADQTVAVTDTELCFTNTGTTVTTASSEVGVTYYLRDNANDTIVDGPIIGTGSGLTFNTGTLNSSMTYNIEGVVLNNLPSALSFDGVNEFISVANAPGLVSTTGQFTSEIWARSNTATWNNYGLLMSKRNSYIIHTELGTNDITFYLYTDNTSASVTISVSDITVWHHYAMSWDGSTLFCYVDGVMVASAPCTGNMLTSTNNLEIGKDNIAGRYLNGDVDDARIWNTYRTSAEIFSNYNRILSGSETGLVMYLPMNEGSGLVATDITGNGNNGVVNNIEDPIDWILGPQMIKCNTQMTTTLTVTVQDTVAPTPDNATLADVTAECSVTSLTAPTASDNCSATVTVTNDATLPITTQGTTVVTWTYDDGNGNTSTQTQNVVITDVTAPVADNGTLADVTAECSVSMLTAPTATDNCSGSITGTTTTTFPITTQGTTVVTWTYDDGNGNTSTQTQNVVITDVTAPTPDTTNLPDVTATCEVTSLTAPTATDNCSGSITGTTTTTFPITTQGTTVVTWTYDDGNGNTSTQTQNVIVSDPNIDVTTTTVNGLTITANNTTATSYQWIDCGNNNAPISGETSSSYTATANGNYAVIITEGNCSDTSACVQITNVGIEELASLGVRIYPIPNNGEFTISTTQNDVSITIYTVDGKIIINQLQITEANQIINLGDVESGIYFVKITNSTGQRTIRLVVE